MTVNSLQLSGSLLKKPVLSKSPAGVPHCSFQIEHKSQQTEAEFQRNSYCIMPVVVSGKMASQIANELEQGSNIRVSGFLTYHKSRNGIGKLVLHAQYIEKI